MIINKFIWSPTLEYILDLLESGRKKKKTNKYLIPILFGALMIKSIIFPLAFKAMAVMSSVAVLLSTMSLIVSSIVGYVKLAMKPNPQIKVVHVNDIIPQTWAKDDDGVKSYALETIDYEASSPVESYRPYYYN